MIRHIFCIIFAGTTVGFLLFTNCEFQKSSHNHQYTDPQYGFRIASPDSDWIVTDETGISEVLAILKSKAIISDFIPNVTISIETLPCMMTAVEYGEKNHESLTAQGYKILSREETMINQNTFYDLQCLNRNILPSLQFRYLCLVKNRIGFIITCTATEKHYAEFAGDFESILSSFRFL
jgi:hypothetical protein